MQEPLLESESPQKKLFSKKTLNLLGQSLMKKLGIRNELPVVERLPMHTNPTFVESSVKGVDYKGAR